MKFYIIPKERVVLQFENLLDDEGRELTDDEGNPLQSLAAVPYKYWLFWRWRLD